MSIIVTSYTTERIKDIFELLDSIKDQTYSNTETIFVVEGSRGLYERVRAYVEDNRIFNMTVVFSNEKLGLSAARNVGVKEAKGDILAFVDDDAVLFPEWAQETVKTYQDDSIIGVTGPAIPLWKGSALEWFPEEFYWLIGGTAWYDQNVLVDVRNAWGMNMSFKRQAFAVCGGFQSDFGLRNVARSSWRNPPSEDVDFSFRVKRKTGKRIVYSPGVRVYHRISGGKVTLAFVMQRAFSVGYQRRMIKKFYEEPDKDDDVLVFERKLTNRIFTRLLPSILGNFFKNPGMTLRRALITLVVLTSVGLGYYSTT